MLSPEPTKAPSDPAMHAPTSVVLQELLDQGVSTRRGIMAIHREYPYRDARWDGRLPETNLVADTAIILPLFYEMREEEQDYVINSLEEVSAMAR